eukprot:234235-Hanusia_phi.AAC.1
MYVTGADQAFSDGERRHAMERLSFDESSVNISDTGDKGTHDRGVRARRDGWLSSAKCARL